MTRFLSLFIIVGFFASQKVSSQGITRVISGLVTSRDGKMPLPGVLVYVKGTKNTSGTQQDGMYYIEVTDQDSILVFTYDDYQTCELRLAGKDYYSVSLVRENTHPAGKPVFSPVGIWRAVFNEGPDGEVPVNFDIRDGKDGMPEAFFHNAEEEFDGGQVRVTEDTLFIFLDQFDNELAFRISDTVLTGVFRKQDRTGETIPVTARRGVGYRFPENGIVPSGNVSGVYDIVFTSGNQKEEKAVALLHQQGNKLRGTFLRVTGDTRYLDGIVEGNNFWLSSFIGSSPSYYKGTFTRNGRLTGKVVDSRGGLDFTGVRNGKAALPDPYRLTYLKSGYSSFDFSLPDAGGETVTLKDEKYRNKVVIVTIGGTWCPNCVDETAFLAPWYKANRDRGVEIISIQYERQTDPVFVRKVLNRMRFKYDIEYDQVFGGIADKQNVAASLPALNTFLAFPTTIIIDKKGRVAGIHTGYSGPATGKYYKEFIRKFNQDIDSLLKE